MHPHAIARFHSSKQTLMKTPIIMKQHIPTNAYQGYTVPFPLFTEAEPLVCADASLGREAFSKKHPAVYLFPDPFLMSDKPARSARLAETLIVVGDSEADRNLAKELQAAFRSTWKIEVPAKDASATSITFPSDQALILVGGAESNSVTMQITKKYQVGLFSSFIPGPGGWGVTTYAELQDGAAPCFVLSADPSQIGDAVEFFVQNVVHDPQSPTLRWTHHIVLGETAKKTLGTFSDMRGGFLDNVGDQLLEPWRKENFQQPYREALVNALHQEFPEGLVYNAILVDLPMTALRHYQMTGDSGGLHLFREMMWGLWNYLNSPSANIYISDLDFRLGILINYWNWIQHHPSITAEERKIFPKTLLGLTRMVCGYYINNWLAAARSGGFINHVTFKARSLLLAARYFQSRIPEEAAEFQALADEVFASMDLGASKYGENAGGYETFLPEHLLCSREVTAMAIPPEMQQGLAIFALREWTMLDNFFFLVDYGDCDPILKRQRPFEVAPWLKGDTSEQKLVRALERSGSSVFPATIAPAFRGFTGLEHGYPEETFLGPDGWMKISLDPHFGGGRSLTGPASKQFDKLTWRSGWTPDSAYLAIEGVGNESIAHSHNEANSILRMNLEGRIWLVNNGYGRRDDIKGAQARFATRNRGPEDHNMLIVRSPETNSPILPPPNCLLEDRSDGPIPYSITEMPDYAGLNWRRHVFVLPNGTLVIDRVKPLPGTIAPAFELQWNVLGEVNPTGDGALITQKGVHLVFQHSETSNSNWEESSIAVWRRLIAEGKYANTQSPPTRCTLRPVAVPVEEECAPCFFASGFWIEDPSAKTKMTWCADRQELQITSLEMFKSVKTFKASRDWGTLAGHEHGLTISLS